MKKILSVAVPVLALFFTACGDDERTGGNTVVSGKLSNSNGDTVYLVNVSQSNFSYIDSAVTGEDGSFEFRPTLEYKGFYKIEVGKEGEQFAIVILAPKDSVTLTGDAANLGYSFTTTGSEDTKLFLEFNQYFIDYDERRRPLTGRIDSLQRTFQIQLGMMTDSVAVKKLEKEIIEPLFNRTQDELNVMADEATVWLHGFVDAHPASFANIPALRLLEPFDNFEWWEKTVNALEKDHKTAPNVVLLRDLVERKRPMCKGQMAPEISLNDVNGKPVKLSQTRGNFVLIDFWASWCAPCRAELPNVVSNYKKYNKKGFEIFSVSLDDKKADWEAAIKSDGLIWPWHVSDLMRGQSPVVAQYEVESIPQTFLLDREGRIIDKGLSGDELGKKLEEVFLNDTAKTK